MTDPAGASPSAAAQLAGGVDVDAVAAAVRACPGVDDLDGGPFDAVASYLPGRRVPGVRVSTNRVMVQVRGRWGVPLPQVGDQVRAAVHPFLAGRRLDIVVSDIADPPPPVPENRSESETAWGSSSDNATVVPSSASTIPTGAEIPPSSSPALPPSTPPT